MHPIVFRMTIISSNLAQWAKRIHISLSLPLIRQNRNEVPNKLGVCLVFDCGLPHGDVQGAGGLPVLKLMCEV